MLVSNGKAIFQFNLVNLLYLSSYLNLFKCIIRVLGSFLIVTLYLKLLTFLWHLKVIYTYHIKIYFIHSLFPSFPTFRYNNLKIYFLLNLQKDLKKVQPFLLLSF